MWCNYEISNFRQIINYVRHSESTTANSNHNKKTMLLKILLLTLSLLSISFFIVWLVTSPAIWSRFDFTQTSGIGETIGGITSPLLGIISVVFLYLTLNKQIDSINDQKLKNESDIIFMMLNQLDQEYNQIYNSETSNGQKNKLYGHEALTKYTNSVFNFYNENDKRKFSDYYVADSILLVIRSFKLIEKRIKISNLSSDFKHLFTEKLNHFYMCRLDDSIGKLVNLFSRVEALNDNYTEEISRFYQEHKK